MELVTQVELTETPQRVLLALLVQQALLEELVAQVVPHLALGVVQAEAESLEMALLVGTAVVTSMAEAALSLTEDA